MIKNIIFDMGNVLLDYNPWVSINKYCAKDEEKEVIYKELFCGAEWVQLDYGNMTDDEAFLSIAKRVPDAYHKALRDCLDNWHICMQPGDGTLEFFREVKEAGYKLYVLSNASDRFYKYFPKYYPLDCFEGVVVSCDIHMVKPDERIYEYIIDRYGIVPEESLFIDDRIDNINAAIDAGILGVTFDGNWENVRKVLGLNKKEYIFLDLDGTLTDPGIGITNSVMHALKYYGIIENDRTKLYKFIGPPLVDSFMRFYGFSEEEAHDGVERYREHFGTKGLFENEVYDGIKELLKALCNAGKKLVLATSKPYVYAEQILEHFELREYFTFVAGSNFDESRSKKSEVIEYAIESVGVTDRSKIVMIGDRLHDVCGARECGLDSIGVMYGYGDFTELYEALASFIVKDVKQLYSILL